MNLLIHPPPRVLSLRGWVLIVLASFFIVGAPVATVFAQDAPPPVTTDVESVSAFVIASPIVTLIVSLLIPLINGLVTTRRTAGWVKGVVTILLNAISALITNGMIADGSSVFSSATLYTAILGTTISVVSYFQLWRPLNLTSSDQLVSSGHVVEGKLARKGIT